jgi:hypothetical protein
MVNQSNAHYTSLRNQAREHGNKAHQFFEQSQQAYQSGDGARAHELSEMGKAETRKKDQIDDEAEEWIYRGALLVGVLFGTCESCLMVIAPFFGCREQHGLPAWNDRSSRTLRERRYALPPSFFPSRLHERSHSSSFLTSNRPNGSRYRPSPTIGATR